MCYKTFCQISKRVLVCIVSYPTTWSLYSSLDFCVDHLSWQWRPHIAGCKMFLTLLRAELAVLTHFFCKMYQWYMWGRQKPENGVFLSLFPPKKWPRKLTHDCFPKIRIDPYIWQAPSNVLTTGWEDWSLFLANDPYFWQSSEGHKKTASLGHKNDFFHQNLFFFRGSHPRQLFFAKKRTHFGQV